MSELGAEVIKVKRTKQVETCAKCQKKEEIVKLECGHGWCQNCWEKYFEDKFGKNVSLK